MKHFLSSILTISTLAISTPDAMAQDTLWVSHQNDKAYFEQIIQNNESIFKLSKRYNIPLATIADHNDKKYRAGFKNGDTIILPIDKSIYTPEFTSDVRPLYYKVANNENLMIISRFMSVRPSLIQEWNKIPTNTIKNGDVLLVGWIKIKDK